MLNNILETMTLISSDEDVNTENYMGALNYIDNVYKFISIMEPIVDINKLEFLPSFKDVYVVERIGMASTAEENELRKFIVKSDEFLGNKELLEKIKNNFSEVTETFEINGDRIITIVLKH